MTDTVRAAQILLDLQGFDPGPADGLDGPRTRAAAGAFLQSLQPPPRPSVPAEAPRAQWGPWPAYAGMAAFYGPPGGPLATQGRCVLPFPFVVAWAPDQRVTAVSCHSRCAAAFTSIWAEAARHYGEAEFRRLRLDRFGGCFNNRLMIGGTRPSTHSWGAAWDVDPERNQLTWGSDRASLAAPALLPFWQIVEAHGAVSLGRARNRDWMHFQFANL